LELCRGLGVKTLVVAGDLVGPLSEQDIDRARISLRQAGVQAEQFGVRIALEFQAAATLANNLQTAASLVSEADCPNLGLCLDAFHYYTGPSKLEDLADLPAGSLLHVQLCDLVGRPRELAADADRVLPGDGDFRLEALLRAVRATGYQGYVSVELMNPIVWQVPARQFGELAWRAVGELLARSLAS
jgi:4-hydroxyphenylpyruvate dioxygenase